MLRICIGQLPLVNKRSVFLNSNITVVEETVFQIVQDSSISLQVWYDAADKTSIQPTNPADESLITQWNDKSKFARNANPDGGVLARPSYETTNLKNGNGYLEFNNGNVLTVNPFSSLASTQFFTAFVVAKSNDLSQANCIFTTNQSDLRVVVSNTTVAVGMNGADNFVSANVVDDNINTNEGNWHQYTVIYDGTQSLNENKINTRRNKNQLSYNVIQGTIPSTFSPLNNSFRIGQRVDGTGQFIGFIGEIILFNRVLTQSEYQGIENYLSFKWGL